MGGGSNTVAPAGPVQNPFRSRLGAGPPGPFFANLSYRDGVACAACAKRASGEASTAARAAIETMTELRMNSISTPSRGVSIGARLVIAMSGCGVERWYTNRDVLGAPGTWSAISDPFAAPGDDRLT